MPVPWNSPTSGRSRRVPEGRPPGVRLTPRDSASPSTVRLTAVAGMATVLVVRSRTRGTPRPSRLKVNSAAAAESSGYVYEPQGHAAPVRPPATLRTSSALGRTVSPV
ncbi:hypothetical protein GUI43_05833 [Micromonospora noduli]|nr:hypothetical protein GUI43_05833 [Micromonospora noduli]RAO56446.1 hypothetical protein ONO86_00696 [Micromonospora noduli]